jgi:hypothetical protein
MSRPGVMSPAAAERARAALRAGGGARWDYLWELHAALLRLPATTAEAQHHAA